MVLALAFAALATYATARLAFGDEGPPGIRGTVTIGCLDPTRCPMRPLSAVQRVYRGSFYGPPPYPTEADIVATFRSRRDGSFELELPPGHYTIDQTPDQRLGGTLNPTDVVVRTGQFSEAELLYLEPRG